MPWCEQCSRFLNPNSVATDGSCPSCGRAVEVAERSVTTSEVDEEHADEGVKAPWHFWVMIAGVALYLGWRLVQGVFWAAHNWF